MDKLSVPYSSTDPIHNMLFLYTNLILMLPFRTDTDTDTSTTISHNFSLSESVRQRENSDARISYIDT